MGLTVFVSSTVEDLADVRDELYERLTEHNYVPWMFRKPTWRPVGETRIENCKLNAADADAYVLIADRSLGTTCEIEGTTYTEAEYRARDEARSGLIPVFVRKGTWAQLDVWRKLPPSLRESAEATGAWRASPELFEFLAHLLGDERSKAWFIVFESVRELWEYLTRWLEYVAASLPHGVSAEQVDMPRLTREAPRHAPATAVATAGVGPARVELKSLEAAHGARALAISSPMEFATRARAAAVLLEGGPPGFWFLRNMLSRDWLTALNPPLRSAAMREEGNLAWALGSSLGGMAQNDPDKVVASSLITALWNSENPSGFAAALNVIKAANAWEQDSVASLLEGVVRRDAEELQRVAYRLAQYGRTSTDAADFALSWLTKWIAETPEEVRTKGRPPFGMPLNSALNEVLTHQPEAGLDYALELLDAHLPRANETEVLLDLRTPMPSPSGDDSPAIQVRHVLASKLAEHATQARVLDILDQLVGDDNRVKRVLAMDVAKENVPACKDIASRAVQDRRNFGWPEGQWACYLISQVFPILSDGERQAVEASLLALPDSHPEEGQAGARKLYALQAIPAHYVTGEVEKAIEALLAANPELSPERVEPEAPGQPMQYTVGEYPECPLDFDSLVREPASLVEALCEFTTEAPELGVSVWFSCVEPLGDALKRAPDAILPVAEAMAAAPPRLHGDFAGGVAWAARQSEGLSGQQLLEIADALEPIATSEGRKHLAQAIAEHWDTVSPESQVTAIELLCEWTRPEMEPDPEPEADEQRLQSGDSGDAADIGLNTARGAVGTALIEIAKKAEAEVREQALDCVMNLTSDPAASVRAIVLLWLGNIAPEVERQWLLQAVQQCISDLHPEVLPYTRHILRFLTEDEASEFGAFVARAMVHSGEKAAETGGLLAALWSLRFPECEVIQDLADEVMNSDSIAAKSEAARVGAYNLLDDDEGTRVTCQARCTSGDDVDLSRAHSIIKLAAQDDSRGSLEGLSRLLYRSLRRDPEDAETVAVIIAGILENESEEAQSAFLHTNAHMLEDIYHLLADSAHEDLALRLLDCACHYCIPAAQPLLEAYADAN